MLYRAYEESDEERSLRQELQKLNGRIGSNRYRGEELNQLQRKQAGLMYQVSQLRRRAAEVTISQHTVNPSALQTSRPFYSQAD